MMKIFILNPLNEQALGILRVRLDPKLELVFGPELPDPADYNILVAGRPERLHLESSSQLQILVIPFAGLPDPTRQLLQDFPHLRVHNLHHNAVITAEMALALLLAAAKFLVPFDQEFRKHDWSMRYQPNPSVLLHGKTALILGYGHIGQRVGIALKALGMRVLALRRNVSARIQPGAPGEVYSPHALCDLLPLANVLIVTLPLTDETSGLLGEVELALLPQGALLVNVGRGEVIDQAALYHALKGGRLTAAGLDVWYNYPRTKEERVKLSPADYPFHELENLVLSPHRAGLANETEILRAEGLAELLNAAVREDPIPNRVNLQAGY